MDEPRRGSPGSRIGRVQRRHRLPDFHDSRHLSFAAAFGHHRTEPEQDDRIRVLIAQEDRSIRDFAAHMLTDSNMVVHVVDNPYDIFPVLEGFKADVVVLDESFPTSGFDYQAIVPELASKYPYVRIVVIADPIGTEEAWARGVSSMVSRRDALFKGGLAQSVKEALKA